MTNCFITNLYIFKVNYAHTHTHMHENCDSRKIWRQNWPINCMSSDIQSVLVSQRTRDSTRARCAFMWGSWRIYFRRGPVQTHHPLALDGPSQPFQRPTRRYLYMDIYSLGNNGKTIQGHYSKVNENHFRVAWHLMSSFIIIPLCNTRFL